MKKYNLLLILLFLSFNSIAQNWKGISNSDTTFFSASTMQIDSEWNGLLRCVWVETSTQSGSDSVFEFNKATGNMIITPCFDTNGMTWLGPLMIRTINGVEYYFNSAGDTLVFQTNGNLGDTWKVMTDTLGLDFYATVTNMYMKTIDGVSDSVKEFTLQAWQGGVMVSNYYNNMTIELSKEHGFISIPQLEIFPYQTTANFYSISNLHPGLPYSHFRIGNSVSVDFNHLDLISKYSPGNEWIYETSLGYGHYTEANPGDIWSGTIITNHDSIISSNLLSPNSIEYTYQRKQNELYRSSTYIPATGTFTLSLTSNNNTSIITDTVYQNTQTNFIHAKYCGDLFTLLGTSIVHPYHYFVDTVCSYLRIRCDSTQMPNWYRTSTCWKKEYPVGGFQYYRTSQIADMGFYEGYRKFLGSSYELTMNNAAKLHYLKTKSCTYLNKFNVFILGTNDDKLIDKSVDIYPNPFHDQINIHVSDAYNSVLGISILDLSGVKILESKSPSTRIDTRNLKPGMYLLELKTLKGNVVKKIVKQP